MPDKYTYLSKNKEKGLKRLVEVDDLVNSFKNLFKNSIFQKKFDINDVTLMEEASQKICDLYYENLEKFKERMVFKEGYASRVNKFKIVSGMEIAICQIQPFSTIDSKNERLINAYFALFAALGILMAWKEDVYQDYLINYALPNVDESDQKEIDLLLIEHIDWLCYIEGNSHLDYFSNAQTWWALRMLLRELNEKQ